MQPQLNTLLQTLVLAQSRSQSAGSSAQSELFGINTQGLVGLGIAAAIIAIVLVVVYFLKCRTRPAVNNSMQLFRELCDAHQLGRRNRDLLFRFAKDRKVSNPCLLFVNNSLWQTGDLPSAPGTRQHAEQQKLDQLRKTVFTTAKNQGYRTLS